MINKNLPEPPIADRSCLCGKHKRLKGQLIHVPDENYTGEKYRTIFEDEIESFSFWNYRCAWCRAIDTKQKKRMAARLVSIILFTPGDEPSPSSQS